MFVTTHTNASLHIFNFKQNFGHDAKVIGINMMLLKIVVLLNNLGHFKYYMCILQYKYTLQMLERTNIVY